MSYSYWNTFYLKSQIILVNFAEPGVGSYSKHIGCLFWHNDTYHILNEVKNMNKSFM